jgi:hypothetical protein
VQAYLRTVRDALGQLQERVETLVTASPLLTAEVAARHPAPGMPAGPSRRRPAACTAASPLTLWRGWGVAPGGAGRKVRLKFLSATSSQRTH